MVRPIALLTRHRDRINVAIITLTGFVFAIALGRYYIFGMSSVSLAYSRWKRSVQVSLYPQFRPLARLVKSAELATPFVYDARLQAKRSAILFHGSSPRVCRRFHGQGDFLGSSS